MALRIPKVKIILSRKGVRVSPEIGKPFEFTAEEISDIQGSNPDALGKVLTSTVIEGGNNDAGNEKVALAERATELGLTFAKNISVAKLKDLIAEAEAKANATGGEGGEGANTGEGAGTGEGGDL